jgi:hypothetical protein
MDMGPIKDKFEGLMEAAVKTFQSDLAAYGLIELHWHFGGTYYFHLQGRI